MNDFSPIYVAGFMSGTSLDAVDGAVLVTDGRTITDFGPTIERKYTDVERACLQRAVDAARQWHFAGPAPKAAFDAASKVLLDCHLEAFAALQDACGPNPIMLAGIHGQTVLHHRPKNGQAGRSLQIFDAEAFVERTGCALVHDFRTADIAAGGEGAPLAPAYHAARLESARLENAAVLNLGGVANLTARDADGDLIAFDCGPANGPLDEWVAGHDKGTCDQNGAFAAAGHVHEGLLAQWLDHQFFGEAPPKSLDRYDFDANLARGLGFEDGCATLTAFTAEAVSVGLNLLPRRARALILCGGGRHNPTLVQALRERTGCSVSVAEDHGWRGDSIEAEAFAFLAVRSQRNLPLSWPGTTGVGEPLSGGVYLSPDMQPS